MKNKMLKKFLVVGIVLFFIFGLYICMHSYANSQIINQYAVGFEKNALGDYCKNESGLVLSVYKASLFNIKTNLSVGGSDNDTALIVWVPLFGGEKEYGLIINDKKTETSYQIMVDEQLVPYDKEDEETIKGYQAHIAAIKAVAKKTWNL